MLLSFTNGEPFALGATNFRYRPVSQDITPRIILQIEIEGELVDAILDTGATYVVCSPHVARRIGIVGNGLERITLRIRNARLHGYLHRLNLRFYATDGDPLDLEATVFVPEVDLGDAWDDLPSYIGLTGCLERMKYAVDPASDTFYFGPL